VPSYPGADHPVNDDTANMTGIPFAGHGDMQRRIARTIAIAETIEPGSGLVTQHAVWSGPYQSRPSQRIIAGRPSEDGVDPAVKMLPPPGPEKRIDRSRMQPVFKSLAASNDAALQRD
jgi:hypothetical protein